MLESLRFRIAAAFVLITVAVLAFQEVTGSAVATAAVAVVAAGILGMALGRSIKASLDTLARAARTVSGGDLSQRVSPRPPGEVAEVADAFNQMADSLEALLTAASEERNRLIAALNSSSDAVLSVNGEGRVAFANAAAVRLFDRAPEELVGNPFVWVMPSEDAIEALRASREDGRREARLIERPNRQYLQVITAPIVGGGEWVALVVLRDVTDVKRVEQVRRDFVANVSHELRTPLASVKSVIETLQGGALEDEATAREFLARADAEIDRLVQMVEELLELSRIESGEVPFDQQPVEMGNVLAEAVERLWPQAERQGLKLTLDVSPDLPPVVGDAERLGRVAVNLLQNAIKFTPAGGSIRVSVALAGGDVTVKVSDTGTGIAPEDLPRVFERFYKADRSRGSIGTGLGLAVVRHTVEAHGGSVSAESEPGRGSTFSFSIPAASVAASREPSELTLD
ncbi:MAG: ATP-binding protein [Dehalococcoidia bacterium]|nr:ATP-binding protein [Dehalococcoidia bacterium]